MFAICMRNLMTVGCEMKKSPSTLKIGKQQQQPQQQAQEQRSWPLETRFQVQKAERRRVESAQVLRRDRLKLMACCEVNVLGRVTVYYLH